MADKVLDRLDAFAEYLQSARLTPSFEKVRAMQFEALMRVFGSNSFTLARAAKINDKLSRMLWAPEQLAALSENVASKIDEHFEPADDRRAPLQDYTYVFQYFTARQWETFSSTTVSSADKMETMLLHICSLGCACPSETSAQMFTALLLFCTEGEGAERIVPSVRLETMKAVKTHHKRIAKKVTMGSTRPAQLPANVEEFKLKYAKLWAAAFGEESPTTCPISIACLQKLSHGIPMRASRSDTKASATTWFNAQPEFSQQAQSFAHGMMSQMQQMQKDQELTLQFLAGGKAINYGANLLQLQCGDHASSSVCNLSATSAGMRRVGSRLQLLDGLSESQPPSNHMATHSDHAPPAPSSTAPPPPGSTHDQVGALSHGTNDAPKPAKQRKTVAEATDAMLKIMGDAKHEKAKAKATGKAKGKAKAKAKAKAKVKSKAKAQASSNGIAKVGSSSKPSISWERSRFQYRCPTGIVGPGQNHAVRYEKDNEAERKAAFSKAERWLKEERKRQNIS